MVVRLVSETETESEEQTRLILKSLGVEPEHPEEPRPPKTTPPIKSADVIELMGVLAKILGFRVQLFAGFLGACGIGGYAVYQATPMALVAAGMFNIMVFGPLAWIAHRRG